MKKSMPTTSKTPKESSFDEDATLLSTPNLSVVIVSYNTLEITRRCLQSIAENQGQLKLQVVVVDNASTDGSPEMIEAEFPNVHLIKNSQNLGFAAANNLGFAICDSELILLLNSDTEILGNVLHESICFLQQHQDVAVLGCRVLNPDRTMQRTCFMYPSLLNLFLMTSGLSKLKWPKFFGRAQMLHWQRDTERDVQVVTGCYMVVKQRAMEQVGVLDEAFFFCGEETDWCLRFRKAGWRVVFSPVGEIVHIGNASGRSYKWKRDIMLTEGIVRFNRKHYGTAVALLAFLILSAFNLSHAVLWCFFNLIRPTDENRLRRDHFMQVTKHMLSAWPKNGNCKHDA